MKNKRTFLFAGILVAFLMLAVPFAVVSFDADDTDAAELSLKETKVSNATDFKDAFSYNEESYGGVKVILTQNIQLGWIGDSNDKIPSVTINKSGTYILDLNGYSINDESYRLIKVEAGDVNFTIDGSEKNGSVGSIDGKRIISISYTNGGSLTVIGGDYCANNTAFLVYGSSGSKNVVNISDANITAAQVSGEPDGAIWVSNSAPNELTVTDTFIESGNKGIFCGVISKATLRNVTVNSENTAVEIKSGHVEIIGGSYSTKNYTVNKKAVVNSNVNSVVSTIFINNGYLDEAGNTVTSTSVEIQDALITNSVEDAKPIMIASGDSGNVSLDYENFQTDVLAFYVNSVYDSSTEKYGPIDGFKTYFSNGKISIGYDTEKYVVIPAGRNDINLSAGNYMIVADGPIVNPTEITLSGDVVLTIQDGSKLAGLIVNGNGNDVTISGLMTESAGIAVFDANVVKIQNCNVCGVNEKLHPYYNNIFGISVSESNNVTISGNVISNIETITVDGIKYDGVGIGIYKIDESIAINEGNVVSDTGFNSIWIVDSKDASVTIEDNEIFNWAIDGEGRAIRIQDVYSTVISNNLFSKDTVSENLESTVKVDRKSSEKISVTFNGDILSGNTIFIDDGTTYNILSVGAESTYYCYDTTIRSSLSAEGDSTFHIAKGGMLILLSGATINCTINGPGDARITFYDVAAGPGGATLTGGSIIAGGMYTSGSVTIDTPGNVLDGTFDDVDITVDDVEVEINDDVVFTNGTTVVLENGAKFTEDPVFEAGTKLTIVTGASTEVIQITETSKVSSSGVVRVGFALPIACENGTVYYEKREVMAITVFEGDSYGQYLAKLGVKADPGYFWNNVFTNEFGTSISSSSIVHEGDKLVATCYSIPTSSEAEVEETSGFDIADHVVLIEAVIAVLVLIGFVAYIRKN